MSVRCTCHSASTRYKRVVALTAMARTERMAESLRRATAIQSLTREMDVSSKLKSNSSGKPQATSTQPETEEVPVGKSALTEEIRHRAYEIYLERGKQSGHDVDDCSRRNKNSNALYLAARRRVKKESHLVRARRISRDAKSEGSFN